MNNGGIHIVCKAEKNQSLISFVREVYNFQQFSYYDVIAVFNGVYIEVNKDMSKEDIINKFENTTK